MSNPPPSPSLEDLAAIRAACLDYIAGWYSADVRRMQRCLHPDLVKRTLQYDPLRNAWSLRRPTDAARLLALTQEGGGSDLPEPERTYTIEVLHTFRHIASAAVLSHDFMDYLHLACLDGRWLIVDALWELVVGEVAA